MRYRRTREIREYNKKNNSFHLQQNLKNLTGYRAITRGVDPKEVVILGFHPESSIGRVCSQIIKTIIQLQRTNPKKAYIIEDPSSLTFSSSLDYLMKKYKLKFSCGGKSKGPYYKKSVIGIFKLILRTMMKYKQKHRDIYKKICVFLEPNKMYQSHRIQISVRSSKYNRTTRLSELVDKL